MRNRLTSTSLALAVLTAGLITAAGCGGNYNAPPTSAIDPSQDTSILAKGPSRASNPTVRQISPDSGAVGDSIRIDGFAFNSTSQVFFAGLNNTLIPATTTVVSSSGRLTAIVPTGAATGAIVVRTTIATAGGGTLSVDAASPGVFTSTTPPTDPGTDPGTPPAGGTFPQISLITAAADANLTINSAPAAVVQFRPGNRLRIEATADTPPNLAQLCTVPLDLTPKFPSLNAIKPLLENPALGLNLRGQANVILQPTVGQVAPFSSVVPNAPGGVIDVTAMPIPPDEPEVAVGNDALGNVLEIVWLPADPASGFLQAAPIIRIQLADTSLSQAGQLLKMIYTLTLERADGTAGPLLDAAGNPVLDGTGNPVVLPMHWAGEADNIEVPVP